MTIGERNARGYLGTQSELPVTSAAKKRPTAPVGPKGPPGPTAVMWPRRHSAQPAGTTPETSKYQSVRSY